MTLLPRLAFCTTLMVVAECATAEPVIERSTWLSAAR
jgi:hypothetical protein